MSSKYDSILIGENGMRISIILFFLNVDTNSIMGSAYVWDKILNGIDFARLTVIGVPFTM